MTKNSAQRAMRASRKYYKTFILFFLFGCCHPIFVMAKEEGIQEASVLFYHVHSVRHSSLAVLGRESFKYNTVQGYSLFADYLEENGFKVRFLDSLRITKESLNDVDVYFLGLMSNDARKLTKEEIDLLLDFVRSGGGLHVVVDHTNVYDSASRANELLNYFDIFVRDDMVMDSTAPKPSWYAAEEFIDHPVTKDLSLIVAQAGCSLRTDFGIGFSSKHSWSDRGDPYSNSVGRYGNKKKDPGEEVGPLPILAARDFGKGRIVVTTEANLFGNSWLLAYDHHKLALNSMMWLSRETPTPQPQTRRRLLVYESDPGLFRCRSCASGFYTFYSNFGRLPSLYAYLQAEITYDWDAIFLLDAPKFSLGNIERLQEYVDDGGILILLGRANRTSENMKDLLSAFTISLDSFNPRHAIKDKLTKITGDSMLIEGVEKLPTVPYIEVKGTEMLVNSESDVDSHGVYLAKKQYGKGEVYVIPFAGMFSTARLGGSIERPGQEQKWARRLQENLLKEIVRRSGVRE